MKLDLPPGDLPAVLQDGLLLCLLAETALPGFNLPAPDASPAERIEAFAAACHQIGIPQLDLLRPAHLLPGPERSAHKLAHALSVLAREGYVRGMLPALRA
uniref:Calponin-homology (CH) domain-containing protein n=1 Tax=Haptolina ericina TaxID=156174 RepID=A0A7S3BAY7_9EUKA